MKKYKYLVLGLVTTLFVLETFAVGQPINPLDLPYEY